MKRNILILEYTQIQFAILGLLTFAGFGFATPSALDWSVLEQAEFKSFALSDRGHHLECTASKDGAFTIRTTGTDPYISTEGLAALIDPFTPYVIGFQYQAPADSGSFQVLFETPSGLKHVNTLLKPADSWRWHFIDLTKSDNGLGEPVNWLRFDFGNHSDRQFQIRDCRLIKASPEFDISKLEHSPFTLRTRGHHAEIESLPNGEFRISTTGNDPYVSTAGLVDAHDPNTPYIIAFEYQAPPDYGDIHFYYNTSEGLRHSNAGVKPSEEWAWHLYDFSQDGKGLGCDLKSFRIDFGAREDLQFTIRNCRLIKATPELRLRAAIGEKAEQMDRFGISLAGITPQQSAVETLRQVDEKSVAVTVSAYRHLDLDAETKRFANEASVRPPVPLGPRIVAGEGEHPDNHTVVRVLSRYQVCETQFLAYPPHIRGGVGVETGLDQSGESFIAAWPLVSQDSREVRLFNSSGGYCGSIAVGNEVLPPYTVVAGDFDPSRKGDEIAVAQRYAERAASPILVYSTEGDLVTSFSIPEGSTGERREIGLLDGKDSGLFAQDVSNQVAWPIHPAGESIAFNEAKTSSRLFASAYPDREFNLGGPEDLVSTLSTWKDGRIHKNLDAGRMENIFWFDPQEVHGGSKATWESFPDGKYIKNSLYNFLGAAQYWSPLLKSGKIEGKTYQDWVSGIDWERSAFSGKHRKSFKDYDTGVPTVWTAAFTHRWSINRVKTIASKRDSKTWLPQYLLLDRTNESTGGGYFGKRMFDYGSQNFEQEALDQFYTYSQRAFYRKLAPVYRNNPEMTVAVEPNHENEIVSGSGSVGDYNSKSLEGFYHYLTALYGSIESINEKMGTPFTTDFFDAPRGIFRGAWDRYHSGNLFFREWVEYNRTIIYRRVGSSYREVLLAGFPSELIKCHQIPDSYVFGSIVGISEKDFRISPIDWLLTTGAGFGFSRYGTYYQREHNIGQGAHSSGFDGMLIGEYASLNPSPEEALDQLLYLRDRGVSSLHVMWWPTYLDKGFNRAQEIALREMIEKHDEPRSGLAGGINQVRSWRGKGGSYDVVSLGTGEENTGLIKSLKADGSFEGTVYTVPFHAHVDIEELRGEEKMIIAEAPIELAKATHIRQGSLFEITFTVDEVDANAAKGIQIGFHHAGVKLEDKTVALEDIESGKHVRIIYKIPLILDEIAFSIATPEGAVSVSDVAVIRHQDQAINLTRKVMEGKRHQGGVTFDVLADQD